MPVHEEEGSGLLPGTVDPLLTPDALKVPGLRSKESTNACQCATDLQSLPLKNNLQENLHSGEKFFLRHGLIT